MKFSLSITFLPIILVAVISCDNNQEYSCFDGIQNGAETGIDCGGSCMPCTCFNGIKDGNEECIDCGLECTPCQILSGRYIDPVFDSYIRTSNLYYGYGIVEPHGNRKYLSFSFYEPGGDSAVSRPLIIFIGQTTYGENADGTFFTESINYLDDFISKGYTVANIIGIRHWQEEYPLTVESFNLTAMKIREDIRGAVRYFKKNAETFKLDTTNIWLMGASMGAMAALHAAYLGEEDFDEIDPDFLKYIENDSGVNIGPEWESFSGSVKGVIILSGMLFDPRIIDSGEPYLFSIFGKEDVYRPFQCDSIKVDWIQEKHYFCGPEALQERMDIVGFQKEAYHFKWIETPPANHMAPFEYAQCPECPDEITSFIAPLLGYCPSND